MSNSFDLDPVLPDPLLLLAGRELTAVEITKLAGLANWNIAYSGANNVWSQSWPEGVELDGSTRGSNLTQGVKVPFISARHTSYAVAIYAEGDPSVTIGITSSSYSTSCVITTKGWYLLELPASSTSSTDDLITLTHELGGGSGFLYGVSVEVRPLTSPLAAGDAGGEPFGLAALSFGRPLSASYPRQLLSVAGECKPRPRMLSAWSAINTTVGKFNHNAVAGAHGGFAYRHYGSEPYTYQVRAKVRNKSATSPQVLRIGAADIQIPVAAGANWVSGTIIVRYGTGTLKNPLSTVTLSDELIAAGWSCMYSTYGDNWELQDPTTRPSTEDLEILSLSVWGG